MPHTIKPPKAALALALLPVITPWLLNAQSVDVFPENESPEALFYLDDNLDPLHNAVEASDLASLEQLLLYGLSPNQIDKHGNTPLIYAASLGKTEGIHILLQHGADPSQRNNKGQTFIAEILEKDHPAIELLKILDNPKIRAFIHTLPLEERAEYAQMLATRAFVNTAIGPLITWFEEQFGLAQSELANTPAHLDPWRLKTLWESQGAKATQTYMHHDTWIGIITDEGVSYDSIIKATRIYQEKHPHTQFAYLTREMADSIGLTPFSGLIFPGGSDNYPGHLGTFTLEDMPEHEQTEKEKTYQYLYKLAQRTDIPILGICAGAQHLVLHKGGALTHNKTHNQTVSFELHHVPHFLSLSPEERQKLLETCEAEGTHINIFRAHKYSAVTETVHASGLTLAMEDGETPLAYYDGFGTIAVQFHPEARYEGVNRYGDVHSVARQTHLMNGFFALCENYKAWTDWAIREGYNHEEAMALRNASLQKILDRLEACRDNPNAQPVTWEDSVTFEL